jgi:hypothetical protein
MKALVGGLILLKVHRTIILSLLKQINQMAFFKSLSLSILFFLLVSFPLAFFELAFGFRSFRVPSWFKRGWDLIHFFWSFLFNSRYAFVFGAFFFWLSPIAFCIVLTLSYLSAFIGIYNNWRAWARDLFQTVGVEPPSRNKVDKRHGKHFSLNVLASDDPSPSRHDGLDHHEPLLHLAAGQLNESDTED